MTAGTLYIISAASGTGKTSLVNVLLQKTPNIMVSVSHTTRPKREGEKGGKHYHFVEKEEFEALIGEGDFLEHAQVFGNYYGTSQSAVQEQLITGVDVILEIDWQGAQQVRHLMPDAVSIFIFPPSRQALLDRLTGRGLDSEEIIMTRMNEAVTEMSHFNEYDYVVINDDFEVALNELQSIFQTERLRIHRQSERHQDMITNLLS
jgi:guanylate kinase